MSCDYCAGGPDAEGAAFGVAAGAATPLLAPLAGAACFLTCSKYCWTYCCSATGTSSRLISPPDSLCVALLSEYCVRICCFDEFTSTVTSPLTFADRLPMISLILPIAASCSARRASFDPSCLPIPLPGLWLPC